MKMQQLIAKRITNMPKSFVREILKVTTDPSVISFAGGLPNIQQDICRAYRQQRDTMIRAIKACFPKEVSFTQPQGGMFLWVTLPGGLSSLDLFDLALKNKVAFVPGTPFYVDGSGENHLRLNFSNADKEHIEI